MNEDGVDVENTVHSSDSVSMDFYDQVGRPMEQKKVKLGDPIMFKIDVSENSKGTLSLITVLLDLSQFVMTF